MASPVPVPKLLSDESVCFTHYQCRNFEEGKEITSMNIYARHQCHSCTGDEAAQIEEFCRIVRELQVQGLQVVHWNQNTSYYGPDHITSRYFELTGKTIELNYGRSLNLSEFLVDKYGDDYTEHSRLDYLARVNHFHGHSVVDGEKKIYPSLRQMLLVKIYKSELRGTLVTRKTLQNTPGTPALPGHKIKKEHKTFPEHLNHLSRERLAEALWVNFRKDKPMTLVLLVHCLQYEFEQPLLTINHGEFKWFHLSMQEFFGDQPIGARQLYFPKPDLIRVSHPREILNVKARIDAVLQAV